MTIGKFPVARRKRGDVHPMRLRIRFSGRGSRGITRGRGGAGSLIAFGIEYGKGLPRKQGFLRKLQ